MSQVAPSQTQNNPSVSQGQQGQLPALLQLREGGVQLGCLPLSAAVLGVCCGSPEPGWDFRMTLLTCATAHIMLSTNLQRTGIPLVHNIV